MRIIIYALITFALVSSNVKYSFAQKDKHRKVESGTYDIIETKTLQIEPSYEVNDFKIDYTKGPVNLTGHLKYATLPSLTISYGLTKRLEISFFSGITAFITNDSVSFSLHNMRTLTLNKTVLGIDASGFGFRFGLLPEKKIQPSINIESNLTMPFLGDSLYRPDNLGADISLGFHSTFSKLSDVSYYAGAFWSGYKSDPYPYFKYTINPGVTINDELYASVDFTSYVNKRSSPYSKLTLAVDYDFSDYVSAELSGGTSYFKNYKSYSIGLLGTFIIDFNDE
jgi:outer membrane protein W